MREKRRSGRRPFDCRLDFEAGTIGSGGYANATYEARGLDISPEGVGLSCDNPLSKGMILRLLSPIPEESAGFSPFAEVVWSAPAGDRFRAGLRFLR